MLVRVRLFAVLRERAGQTELEVELPAGARVSDALERLGPLAGDVPVVMAVNRVYADPSDPLHPGDELALIPPVSGGQELGRARVTLGPVSPDTLLEAVRDPRAGAVVSFQGVTREVERLEYEAYHEMAELEMEGIVDAAVRRHGLCAAVAEHGVGVVALGECSVAVAVSAPHREEAFAGAREIIDEIKSRVPIWKREIERGSGRWVPGTSPGS